MRGPSLEKIISTGTRSLGMLEDPALALLFYISVFPKEEAVSTLTWVIVLLSAVVPWSQVRVLEVCHIGAIQYESLLHHQMG
jgi:hypothetical protein